MVKSREKLAKFLPDSQEFTFLIVTSRWASFALHGSGLGTITLQYSQIILIASDNNPTDLDLLYENWYLSWLQITYEARVAFTVV